MDKKVLLGIIAAFATIVVAIVKVAPEFTNMSREGLKEPTTITTGNSSVVVSNSTGTITVNMSPLEHWEKALRDRGLKDSKVQSELKRLLQMLDEKLQNDIRSASAHPQESIRALLYLYEGNLLKAEAMIRAAIARPASDVSTRVASSLQSRDPPSPSRPMPSPPVAEPTSPSNRQPEITQVPPVVTEPPTQNMVSGQTPAIGTLVPAQTQDPEHVRGQITRVDATAIEVNTASGKTVVLATNGATSIFGLTKASFTEVQFGTYVGAVGMRGERYSPIVRDSLHWLHNGFGLRIIDEKLRGIALGHKKWDQPPGAIMAHGWVDDIEVRVLSIKYGPTEEEETDVEIPRDAPIHKMSLGDKGLLKAGAHIFAGAQKSGNGTYTAAFIIVGTHGIVPRL
jgi:hypothetical protein